MLNNDAFKYLVIELCYLHWSSYILGWKLIYRMLISNGFKSNMYWVLQVKLLNRI